MQRTLDALQFKNDAGRKAGVVLNPLISGIGSAQTVVRGWDRDGSSRIDQGS